MAAFPLSSWAKNFKHTCGAKEIERKDCVLSAGSYKLRLLAETVALNDGTWRSVDPMPLHGEGTIWHKVRFELMNGWPVLQLWIWDKPIGEAQVQSLRWFVASAENRKLSILASGVVRKRRQKESQVDKAEFIYDGWESYGLKVLGPHRIEFTLAREKKILERK